MQIKKPMQGVKSFSCLECGQPMTGIFSYTIRQRCSDCGGHSLALEDTLFDIEIEDVA